MDEIQQSNGGLTFQATDNLLADAGRIIEGAQVAAARSLNVYLTLRNWLLGERIARELLGGEERGSYGQRLVRNLSDELTKRYGKGFDNSSLSKYVKFYRLFPQIADSLSPQLRGLLGKGIADTPSPQSTRQAEVLPWTHYRELIRVDNPDAREWYAHEAFAETWSVRTLKRNIDSQYYFRLLQSQNQQEVRDEMHRLTATPKADPLAFIKNPVVAEFLGFAPSASFTESNLEAALIDHLQHFVMELGKGYAFVARQQHIRTDMGDFYIDLVFYNYILKCFLLIDLKTTQISHQDVGQMDMYVRMYDELRRTEGDNPTIGLILCADTSADMARYSILKGNERLFQAKYLTYLPTEEELRREIERQRDLFLMQHNDTDKPSKQ